ncbi:MAG: DoxX family protein [Candidatus Kapabacteria bacterium]|nr:DoxX family protein [Candidatus Kapabacteria bacterium]
MNVNRIAPLFTRPLGTDFLPTLMRIFLGVLLISHGSDKVFNGMDKMIAELTALGWPMPTLQAFLAAYIEFAGGVLLIVGLLTRPAAVAVSVLFSIIYFVFSAADPFARKEKALIFLVLAVYVFLTGPGKASVDALLFKKTATPAKD